MRMLWIILATLAAIYAGFALLLFFYQSKLIYLPDIGGREITATPRDIGLKYESVTLVAGDGVRLHGWFVPAKSERGVLLFFHGNAGNISHRLGSLEIFNRLGLSILIFDYRGYGQSEGAPSEQGTYRDAEAAWRYLIEKRDIPAHRIVLFGRSLGGAIAAWLAARHTPQALIIESVFTSVPDMASQMYPFLPVRLLARFQYNTRQNLEAVNCPLLVIHSPEDEIVPIEHGRRLFDSANKPKQFLNIRGDHNNGFIASGHIYVNGLNEFLDIYLEEPAQGKAKSKM